MLAALARLRDDVKAQRADRRRCSKKGNLEATSKRSDCKMKNKKMWNNNYKNKNVNRKDEIMYVVFVLYMLAALAWLRDGRAQRANRRICSKKGNLDATSKISDCKRSDCKRSDCKRNDCKMKNKIWNKMNEYDIY